MLRSWSSNITSVPALIKSGGGEVTSLLGSAAPFLLLGAPEPATDSETKQHSSPGSFQSSYGPSSQLNQGYPPTRQPFYENPYSEASRHLNLEPNNRPPNMELAESREGGADGRPTGLGESHKPMSVVVAVDASAKKLRLAALQYALKELVRPGDHLYLLGVLHQLLHPSTSPTKKSIHGSIVQKLGYKQKADTTNFGGTNEKVLVEEGHKKQVEIENAISESQEIQELVRLKQVTPDVKIATGPERKVVTATQAEELGATWVILDQKLKKDKEYLKTNLNCNIVLMKPKNEVAFIRVGVHDGGKGNSPGRFQDNINDESIDIGRVQINDPIHESVNSGRDSSISPQRPSEVNVSLLHESTEPKGFDLSRSSMTVSECTPPPALSDSGGDQLTADSDQDLKSELGPETLEGSPEVENDGSALPEDETLPSVLSSTEMVKSAGSPPSDAAAFYKTSGRAVSSTGDLQSLTLTRSNSSLYRPAASYDRAGDELMNILNPPTSETPSKKSVRRTLQRSLREDDPTYEEVSTMYAVPIGRLTKFGNQNEDNRFPSDNTGHGRPKKIRPVAPLCSVCNHPGPVFGRDAIQFTYAQLEEATNDFDPENYLAEGGYGFVYRGRLEGGHEIAVKQYKAASSQGDDQFFSEVEVLKHAQHRNLVILIGYCKEQDKRLLVYEFVCNKSLDVHLSAKNPNVLEWKARWKIAIGAARGLRYLHEECRVGCIVHRDMRPNNILLTHDFVPMVGDFGLARSQPIGDNPEETRVIGTLGYLAPEYAESGSITEKADVYSFGVVLLELITGRKAIDATRIRGQTCLTEWARPLIQAGKIEEIVDPRLKNVYDVDQVNKMVDAAGRCVRKDKDQRPKMSEVLRILERDVNSMGLMSRDSSFNDLSDTLQNPVKRQMSLNAIDSLSQGKGIVASNVITSQSHADMTRRSTPLTIQKKGRNDKTSKEVLSSSDLRTTSPRSFKSSLISNSPSGKQSQTGSPSAKPKKLSYLDMV